MLAPDIFSLHWLGQSPKFARRFARTQQARQAGSSITSGEFVSYYRPHANGRSIVNRQFTSGHSTGGNAKCRRQLDSSPRKCDLNASSYQEQALKRSDSWRKTFRVRPGAEIQGVVCQPNWPAHFAQSSSDSPSQLWTVSSSNIRSTSALNSGRVLETPNILQIGA